MLNVHNFTLLLVEVWINCAQLFFNIKSLVFKGRNFNLLLLESLTHFNCLVTLTSCVFHSFTNLFRRLNSLKHLEFYRIHPKVQTIHPLSDQLQLFVHFAQSCPMFEFCLYSSLDLAFSKLPKLHYLIFKNFFIVSHCNVQLLFIYEKSIQPSVHNFHFRIQFNLISILSCFQLLSPLNKFIERVVTFIDSRIVGFCFWCEENGFTNNFNVFLKFTLTNISRIESFLLFNCPLVQLLLQLWYDQTHSVLDFDPVQFVNSLDNLYFFDWFKSALGQRSCGFRHRSGEIGLLLWGLIWEFGIVSLHYSSVIKI